ncbi:hypothetical protein KVR01_010292 [Diaporthe batatas]|uniref:uncharacterized protein n=1 Tax=Diaporthe batatas TaxID=748121 RepID=UPI001D058CDE|nr:uncharacterized protein KVR01_010292 [Diaporthe batatas]KAG8159655.1 hypothetical protein KVR01_010292 [Diaporthe batatas]
MAKIYLEHLDAEHLQPFRQALSNILSTPTAESTYAQILDGMPLSLTYRKNHWYWKNFPVSTHNDLCAGALEKAIAARSNFGFALLRFESKASSTIRGSIVVSPLKIAVHDIAGLLWSLDDGFHKHADLEAWLTSRLESEPQDKFERVNLPPHTWFWHGEYTNSDEYPNGVADIVGYWAETQIFGGVVVFDRGESDEECNGVYLHNAQINVHGYTIAPPTADQFTNLVDFLLSPDPDGTQAPLPIAITLANRWRWEPYEAMATYHIFRDRYERRLPPREVYWRPHGTKGKDWPELAEVQLLRRAAMGYERVAPAEISAATDRLMQITPSSRYWYQVEAEVCRLQPDKKKQGRPPYFFDE